MTHGLRWVGLLGLAACTAILSADQRARLTTDRELARFSDILTAEPGRSYILHSYANGLHSEARVEGAVFMPSTTELAQIEPGVFDDGRGSIVQPLVGDLGLNATVTLRANGIATLILDQGRDGLAEAAIRVDRLDDQGWALIEARFEALNDCFRAQRELAGFDFLGQCGRQGSGLSNLDTPFGGGVTSQAEDNSLNWGLPNCTGEETGGSPVAAPGGGRSSDDAKSTWRHRERSLRNRARYHEARADSSGKNPGQFPDRVRAQQEAAREATEAAVNGWKSAPMVLRRSSAPAKIVSPTRPADQA